MEFEKHFDETLEKEDKWPDDSPDMQLIYTKFYDMIHEYAINIVCGSCGIITHHTSEYQLLSSSYTNLGLLAIDPGLVPFDYSCGIPYIDMKHIMIDPLSVIRQDTDAVISVCNSCHHQLQQNQLPRESLANYRWIGPIPEELKDLTWVEEMLIARAHMFGRIIRLGERNHSPSYAALKGHTVLVPQDTVALLNILPPPPDALSAFARVVWIGTTLPDKSRLTSYFSVRKNKVLAALRWLCNNHCDYQNVTIDMDEINQWPSVFVTDTLLDSMALMSDVTAEDMSRVGVATEDLDVDKFEGNIPSTVSAIIDVNNTSESRDLLTISQLKEIKEDVTINVVYGTKILEHYENDSYFTSAFPTIFPWGSGKHRDNRRQRPISLIDWIKLMLRNSSR